MAMDRVSVVIRIEEQHKTANETCLTASTRAVKPPSRSQAPALSRSALSPRVLGCPAWLQRPRPARSVANPHPGRSELSTSSNSYTLGLSGLRPDVSCPAVGQGTILPQPKAQLSRSLIPVNKSTKQVSLSMPVPSNSHPPKNNDDGAKNSSHIRQIAK